MTQRMADITALTAFLAMAVKERLVLNGWTAREVWDAYTRLMGLSDRTASEVLCKMLGDEPGA